MSDGDQRAQFRDSKVVRSPALALSELFSVAGKVALVTGGSRGVGLMIAKALVHNGARVYISARKADVCDRVAAELSAIGPGSCVSLPADVSSEEACAALAAKVAEREDGRLHILVNNAGITWGGSYDKFPASGWAKVMDLNVTSVFLLTRACTPMLVKASGGSTDPSHVINIGSVAGEPWASVFDPAPSYAASKAAVAQLTRWFAAKLCRDGVNVNCIQPAVFPSKMTFDYQLKSDKTAKRAALAHPVGRVGNESDMAGMALFLSSRASAFVTGECICLDGGMSAIRGADQLPLGKSAKL